MHVDLTCDGYIAELSAAVSPRTGYPGPLHGLDFSQTYNCSSSSDVGNNNNNSNYNATGVGRRLRETWYKFSGRRLRETWYKLRRWLASCRAADLRKLTLLLRMTYLIESYHDKISKKGK